MKYLILTAMMLIGYSCSPAQKLPPKPKKPAHPNQLHKSKANKERPRPPRAGEKPYIITPDGKKLYPGDRPA